jgi:hypothetical protein
MAKEKIKLQYENSPLQPPKAANSEGVAGEANLFAKPDGVV